MLSTESVWKLDMPWRSHRPLHSTRTLLSCDNKFGDTSSYPYQINDNWCLPNCQENLLPEASYRIVFMSIDIVSYVSYNYVYISGPWLEGVICKQLYRNITQSGLKGAQREHGCSFQKKFYVVPQIINVQFLCESHHI